MFQHVLIITVFLSCVPAYANWIQLNPKILPTARYENGFVSTDNALFLIGGRGVKPVEKYNIGDNQWTKHAKTPLEMHHITPVYHDGLVWIVTGLTGKYPTDSPLQHVYTYNPENAAGSNKGQFSKTANAAEQAWLYTTIRYIS